MRKNLCRRDRGLGDLRWRKSIYGGCPCKFHLESTRKLFENPFDWLKFVNLRRIKQFSVSTLDEEAIAGLFDGI